MEDEDDLESFQVYVDQLRPFQGARSTSRPERKLDELSDARAVFQALGLPITTLRNRDDDPPDCEAFVKGLRYGVEVTEFAHEASLRRSLQTIRRRRGFLSYYEWTRQDFLAQLRDRLARKDCPREVKGAPYDRYMIVFWTGEMHLTDDALRDFLADTSFSCSLISEGYFVLNYHSQSETSYPIIRIPISWTPGWRQPQQT